jgi:hypothetical protein
VVVLLAARFVLELALLAALAVGAVSVLGGPARWVLALVLVGLAATIWGVCLSPRRRLQLALPVRIALELLLFVAAAALLATGGHVVAAVVLLAAEAVVLSALGGPDRHAGALG